MIHLENELLLAYECQSWTVKKAELKNWCFWTVVLEKTLQSPLDCKEIQPVHPKGDQSWVFIGRTDVEAEIPILWPPDAKNWLIGKDYDAGRDQGQGVKGTTEDEMVGWHHSLNGRGFGWTPGVGDGQGGLACCGSWGCRVGHDWATELNSARQIVGSQSYSFAIEDAVFSGYRRLFAASSALIFFFFFALIFLRTILCTPIFLFPTPFRPGFLIFLYI